MRGFLRTHRAPAGLLASSRRPPPDRSSLLRAIVIASAWGMALGAVVVVGSISFEPEGEAPVAVAALGPSERPVTLVYRDPDAREVAVAGTFNGWSGAEMRPVGDGVFQAVLVLPPGQYEYQFVVDGSWTTDPLQPRQRADGFGSVNSVLDLASSRR